MTEENVRETYKIFSEMYEKEDPRISFQYKFINRQGSEVYCETSLYLRYNEEGEKIGFSGFFKDVTDRVKREQKLKKSQEKYRSILETIKEGYFETDTKGTITYCNSALGDIFGYTPDEMIGMNYRSLMDEEKADIAFKMYNTIYRTEEPIINLQHQFNDKDKNLIYCESSVYLKYDEEGNKRGFRGFMRDITEKVKTKQRLKSSREKYRRIIENSNDGYFELDLNGDFTFLNPAFSELLGHTSEEILGSNYQIYMKEESVMRALELYNEILETEKPYPNFKYELINKQGKTLYCESSIYLRYDDEGNKIGFAGFVRDLTSQKEAEKKFRKIIQTSLEGYFEVDLKGNLTYFNPALRDMLGYPSEEMMGLNYREYMTPEKAQETFNVFNEVFRTGISQKFYQYQVISKQGRTKYGESSVSLSYDERGNKVGFSGFVRDVTDKVEAEKRLKKSEKKYKEAYNRAEFYRDILAHDMSNILSSIKFSFELIELGTTQNQDVGNIDELVEIIQRQIDRASSLIENIRRLSALEKEELIIKTVKINEVLKRSIKSLKNHYISGDISIEFSPLEQENSVCGGDFLIDAFENILLNGIVHNESDLKKLWINISELQKEGDDYIEIEFKDNGIGIPDEEKELIFNREYKHKKTNGMGIGLSLVKKILKEYKGEIQIKNRIPENYRKGSNFIIILKRCD
jgi:PAS domain S-box-containing protein